MTVDVATAMHMQKGPGTCPKCAMALEPKELTAEPAALRAARALLRPDGELHVVDRVETIAMRAAFLSIRLLDTIYGVVGFLRARSKLR